MLIRRRTSVTDLNFHLVLVTKYRQEIFTTQNYRDDMLTILNSIAINNDVQIQSLEVMPDHVHMLITFHPKVAPSSIVKSFKGASARAWFKLHPETKQLLWKGHLWTDSFYMSTVGNVSKDIVKQYIESQMKEKLSKTN